MRHTTLLLGLLWLSSELSSQNFVEGKVVGVGTQKPLTSATVMVKNTYRGVITDVKGEFKIWAESSDTLVVRFIGYIEQEVSVSFEEPILIQMIADSTALGEVQISDSLSNQIDDPGLKTISLDSPTSGSINRLGRNSKRYRGRAENTIKMDHYDSIKGNNFKAIEENTDFDTREKNISTLSIDVDKASFSIVRCYLSNNQLPPTDAVRIEELINYFPYQYEAPAPEAAHPFAVHTEITECPWNPERQLLHVAIQGQRELPNSKPGSNLVFLIDASGSMGGADKIDLLKQGFNLLVDQLNGEDVVSIVVYTGEAGISLPPTSGNEKSIIKEAINSIYARGSTAGEAGIQKAYALAEENFIPNGNNRIILATDGDFNVGISSESELIQLIEEKRKTGIFLTVLGFGMGNLQDSKMEQIADHGNGNYFYLDNEREAKKVLVDELRGTLFTIAKDVKIQVEFNPGKVASYRLIGYENRLLEEKDFKDDKKDAGELGSGHNVTALYEIVPQTDPSVARKREDGETLAYVRLRYKKPDESKSILLETAINARIYPLQRCSEAFQLSCVVAEFGLLLRDSEYKASASYNEIIRRLESLQAPELEADRDELLKMILEAAVLVEAQAQK